MYKAVECSSKIGVTTWHPVHDKPPDIQHGGMVVDVKISKLMVVFAQNEKKCVHELNELGKVVPPEHMNDLVISLSTTVRVLAKEVIAALPHTRHKLIKHVEGEGSECHVIHH